MHIFEQLENFSSSSKFPCLTISATYGAPSDESQAENQRISQYRPERFEISGVFDPRQPQLG
jgi:hypothetical protein